LYFQMNATSFSITSILCVALLASAVSILPSARAQSGEAVLEQIQAGFNRGDARLVLDQSADRLELAITGTGTLFSRSQATYVLQDFFRQFPPDRFSLLEPANTNGSWFAGGTYWSGQSERPFSVYVRIRMRDDRWELREIRIEQRGRE
jgi:hypothetical protein